MSGKHEQKKSQYPLRWLILGTVLILAVAGVTVWRGGMLHRDSGQEQLRKENERYTFDSGVQQVYAGLENGVAVASSTGLQILDGDGYTVEMVTDESMWKKLGLEEGCLFAYCPGCKAMHDDPNVRNLPAVEVNGELKFWSVPATDEELTACLREYLPG